MHIIASHYKSPITHLFSYGSTLDSQSERFHVAIAALALPLDEAFLDPMLEAAVHAFLPRLRRARREGGKGRGLGKGEERRRTE